VLFLKLKVEAVLMLIEASGAAIRQGTAQLDHFLWFLVHIRVGDMLLVVLSSIGLPAIVSVHLETLGSRVRRLCANR
jgi:hypothetical protein